MFEASKQLQALTKRVINMQKEERDKIDFHRKDDLDKTTQPPALMEQNQTLCSGILLQGESKEILQGTEKHFNMLLNLLEDSVTMNDDNPQVLKTTNNDDVTIFPEFRRTLANLHETDDADKVLDVDDSCVDMTCNPSYFQFNVSQNLKTECEKQWHHELQKKDNHNLIERRRRCNINERIAELACLLPDTVQSHIPMHKGSILKATVKYVKDLKKDQERLKIMEASQSNMKSKQKKMLIRIYELELKLNLYKLLSKCKHDRIRKKPKKKSIEEVDRRILENLMKFKFSDRSDVLQMFENKRSQLFQLQHKIANLHTNKTHVLQNCGFDNRCCQKDMPSKSPKVLTDQHTNIYNEFTTMVDTSDSDSEMEYVQHSMTDHTNSNVLRKAECVYQSSKTDASVEEMSTADKITPTCSSASRLHQTKILESLLQRSKIELSSVENSVGTFSSNP